MLVAVESANAGVRLYHRDGDTVTAEDVPFRPWLLIPDEYEQPRFGPTGHMQSHGHFLQGHEYTPLEGGNYNRLLEFDDWRTFHTARRLAAEGGQPILAYGSPAKCYLIRSGKRMMDGSFNDAHRMTLDIETTGLDPQTSQLLMVALADNRGYEELLCGEETWMLQELCRLVQTRDPDVLEGHNVLAFDLPYLLARMDTHGVPARLGRDRGIAAIGRERKMMIGPNERWYAPVYIKGRHVVDTLLMIQKHDVALMRHMSYGLKAVARDLGIEEPDRIELPRDKIAGIYRSNPRVVKEYAMQDVRETQRLADIILPQMFALTRQVPDSYTGVCTTGTGEIWNSIMIAAYLARGKGIPRRQTPESYPGGYVECRATGIFGPIVKADVESLYPSLMLVNNIESEADTEHIMLPMLREFLTERLRAKRKMQETEGAERDYWNGFQNSQKILINGAYGYLGGPFMHADWKAAARVTEGGREVITKVVEALESRGATIIEVDTDGAMFMPPEGVGDPAGEEDLVGEVSALLPEGIVLAHDGRYRRMLSLAMKTYVLLDYADNMKLKGASLKSRSTEPFVKEFLYASITALITARPEDAEGARSVVEGEYRSLLARIYERNIPALQIVRRARITEKTFHSPAKRRLAQAASGLAVGDHVFVYDAEDGTLKLEEEYAADYDVLKYMKKARGAFAKLALLFPDWAQTHPNPGKKNVYSLLGLEPQPKPPKVQKEPKPKQLRPRSTTSTKSTGYTQPWVFLSGELQCSV